MASATAGQRPAHRGMPLPWSDGDTAHAAYRLAAYGFTEPQAADLLERLAAQNVRDVRRCVDGMTIERLEELRFEAERRELDPTPVRRGDLVRVRSIRRWPWRTSTSQPLGGVVA